MNKENCNDRDTFIASYLADAVEFAKQLMAQALNTVLEGELTEATRDEKVERSSA